MLWGDQWTCSCGTNNLTLRRECRKCGHVAVGTEPVVDAFAVATVAVLNTTPEWVEEGGPDRRAES